MIIKYKPDSEIISEQAECMLCSPKCVSQFEKPQFSVVGSTKILSHLISSISIALVHSCFLSSPTKHLSSSETSMDKLYTPHGSSSQKLSLLIPFSTSGSTISMELVNIKKVLWKYQGHQNQTTTKKFLNPEIGILTKSFSPESFLKKKNANLLISTIAIILYQALYTQILLKRRRRWHRR